MPQGGVDHGEDLLSAAYRELEEETSIKKVKLFKELEGINYIRITRSFIGYYMERKI